MKIFDKKSVISWAAASLMVALSFIAFGANIVGTPGPDLLFGTAANDNLNGRGDSDVIVDIFGGNDQINTHSALVAGELPGAFDFVLDTGGNNRIFGGPELLDLIIVTGGNNKIDTGGGILDLVLTGTGNDEVAATSALGVASIADVFIDFGGGSNAFNGNGGLVDILIGGPGNDTITSSAALLNILVADFLFTGTDRNTLRSATTSAFGIPGIGILVDSFGPDKLQGGNPRRPTS